jgi:hypothetical protein
MEFLDICLTTTCFQFEDKFCQQKEVMPMGTSLSPAVSNIPVFMEHFEEITLDTADLKPAKRLGCVSRMDQHNYNSSLHHLNIFRPTNGS